MREISIERSWCRRLGRRRAAGACLPSLALCTATLLAADRSEGATAKTREEAPATVAVSQSGATAAATEGAAAVMAAQAPLLAAAERIKALDPAGAQVGGIQISVETGTLTLWWKGKLSEGLNKEITAQQANHVQVVVRSASYSQQQLLAVARDVVHNAEAYPGLLSVAPLIDGSGLEIGVAKVENAAAYKLSIPFRLIPTAALVALASRRADRAPWSGGAVTRAAVTSSAACSTGFATAQPGIHGIVTSQHCACGGNAKFNSGAGVSIGAANSTAGNKILSDSLFIPTNSSPMIYGGGVGTGEVSLPVSGTQGTLVGMHVCVSGAASGMNCDVAIDKIHVSRAIVDASGHPVCPSDLPFADGLSEAHQVSGNLAAAAGDSGGPVFVQPTAGGPVNAVGILAGGNLDGGGMLPTCPTGLQSCFSKIIFSEIESVKAVYGVEVMEVLGSICSNNAQCASDYCDAGWGTSQTNRCMPSSGAGNLGDICSDDRQCTTQVCNGLTRDASGNWVPGTCAPKRMLGDPCFQNYECGSGYCDTGWGTSQTNRCMPSAASGTLGQICSNDNQCISQVCGGLAQDSQGNWAPGTCGPKVGLGAACSQNYQCNSGYCDAGWGTSQTNLCMPSPGTGSSGDVCSDDRQCASQVCGGLTSSSGSWVPGRCVSKFALGVSCSQNTQCASGYCDAGWGTSKTSRCMPSAGAGGNGDLCSNDNQCVSQVCSGLTTDSLGNWVPGTCASKHALGDACSQNTQCESGYCDAGWGTSQTNRCMPNMNGRSNDICSDNRQCTSQVCVGLHAQGNFWVPGTCL